MEQRVLNREFLKYVFLNVLGQIAYSCYTVADTFFVSAKLRTDGLTALFLSERFGMTGVWCACPATEFVVAGMGILLCRKDRGIRSEEIQDLSR